MLSFTAYYLHSKAVVDAYIARGDAAEAQRQHWSASMLELSRRLRVIIAHQQHEARTE